MTEKNSKAKGKKSASNGVSSSKGAQKGAKQGKGGKHVGDSGHGKRGAHNSEQTPADPEQATFGGSKSMRENYEEGVDSYYQEHGATYRNPHFPGICSAAAEILDLWYATHLTPTHTLPQAPPPPPPPSSALQRTHGAEEVDGAEELGGSCQEDSTQLESGTLLACDRGLTKGTPDLRMPQQAVGGGGEVDPAGGAQPQALHSPNQPAAHTDATGTAGAGQGAAVKAGEGDGDAAGGDHVGPGPSHPCTEAAESEPQGAQGDTHSPHPLLHNCAAAPCTHYGPGSTLRVLDLACGAGEATQAVEAWWVSRGGHLPPRMNGLHPGAHGGATRGDSGIYGEVSPGACADSHELGHAGCMDRCGAEEAGAGVPSHTGLVCTDRRGMGHDGETCEGTVIGGDGIVGKGDTISNADSHHHQLAQQPPTQPEQPHGGQGPPTTSLQIPQTASAAPASATPAPFRPPPAPGSPMPCDDAVGGMRVHPGLGLAIDAADPYTRDAYAAWTGRDAEAFTFQDVASGLLGDCTPPRCYHLVVCSYAMHVLSPSFLFPTLQQLALCADGLLIISPHKLPKVEERTGWVLSRHLVVGRVHVRLFKSTTLQFGEELGLGVGVDRVTG